MALTWALLCHGQCLGKVTRTALSRSLVFESWYKDEKLKAESQQSVCDVLEQGQQILGNNYSFVAWKGEMGVSYKWLLFIYLFMAEDTNVSSGNFFKSGEAGHVYPIPLINVQGQERVQGDFSCP